MENLKHDRHVKNTPNYRSGMFQSFIKERERERGGDSC